MRATTNPITNTAVTTLSWATEPERKLQGLLQLFLERYFSGTAFQTATDAGGLESKTFPICAVKMQEKELSRDTTRPVLDVTFDTITTTRENRTAARRGSADEWLVTILTKVPASMAGGTVPGSADAEQAVRMIADQVLWLFRSAELDALRDHGVHQVSVERPPVIFNAGAWLGRLMTVRLQTYSDQPR